MNCETFGWTDPAAPDIAALVRDPLTRLVMASDGVTEAAFVAVLHSAQRAVEARMAACRLCDPAPRRGGPGLRIVASTASDRAWM